MSSGASTYRSRRRRTVSAAPAGAADDDRQPAGRRLQGGQPEALGVEPAQPGPHRQGEHVGPLQLGDHPRTRDRPRSTVTVARSPQPVDHRLQPAPAAGRRRPGPARADVGPASRPDQPPGPEQGAKPFCATNRPTATHRGATGHRTAGRGRNWLRSTGGGSRSSRRGAPGSERGAIRRCGVVRRWSSGGRTPSPIRRSSRPGAGHRGPPDLVAVGEPDDPLRAGPAQRRGQQTERGGRAEEHPGRRRTRSSSSTARAAARGVGSSSDPARTTGKPRS